MYHNTIKYIHNIDTLFYYVKNFRVFSQSHRAFFFNQISNFSGNDEKTIVKIPLNTRVFFFFCFQLYFDCFIAQSRRKKTYLSPVNLVMTNGSYKKTLIPLIASVNFFLRGKSVIALFQLTMVMFSTHLILSHLSLTWVPFNRRNLMVMVSSIHLT